MEIWSILLSARSFRSESMLRERIPPWTAGWSVLTRPPRISGALVIDETSLQCQLVVRGRTSWSYSLDLDAVLTDQLGRAAGAEEAESESLELLREGKEVGLVVDRQEGCPLAL